MKPYIHAPNNFDGLRLIAAWLVIVGHSYELLALGDPLRDWAEVESLGAVGVIMFFSMSGYLVTLSLLRSQSIGEFLWRRALRILPALWVLVALSVFIWGAALTRFDLWTYLSSPTTQDYLLALFLKIKLYLPGVFEDNPLQPGFNGALWTLPLEAKCYGVLALCALGGKRWLKPLVALAIVLLIALVVRHFSKGVFRVSGFSVDSYLFLKLVIPFFCGVAIALWGTPRWCNVWAGFAALLAVVVCAKALPSGLAGVPGFWLVFAIVLGYFALGLALHTQGWLGFITKRGDFSYGLYLYAFPVQQTLISFYPAIHAIALIVFTTLIALALAWASWNAVEAPMLKEKSRLKYWKLQWRVRDRAAQ